MNAYTIIHNSVNGAEVSIKHATHIMCEGTPDDAIRQYVGPRWADKIVGYSTSIDFFYSVLWGDEDGHVNEVRYCVSLTQ